MNQTNDKLSNERLAMTGIFITIITITANSFLFIVTGGFTAGKQLAEIHSELKILRHEIKASKQIQDYKINEVEKQLEKLSK